MARFAEMKSPLSEGRMHLKETQLAELLNLSERTLQGWRLKGEGPAFEKFGRSVRYATDTVEAWIAAQQRASTSASTAGALCPTDQLDLSSDFARGKRS